MSSRTIHDPKRRRRFIRINSSEDEMPDPKKRRLSRYIGLAANISDERLELESWFDIE